MRRRTLLLSSLALALTAACADPTTPAPSASPAPRAPGVHEHTGDVSELAATATLNSLLRPENEQRPGVPSPVINSVARASGLVRLLDDGRVEFDVKVDNPGRETFVAGHIHEAPVDANGGIVIGFFGPPTRPTDAPISDETFELTTVGDFNSIPDPAALLERIRTQPENFYLNLHTQAEPAGATRGQLGDPPTLDALAVAGRANAAAGGLPEKEMLRLRLRHAEAAGDGQVRVEWGDGNVTYTSVGALPFFGVFLYGYENPGTFEIKVQGGLDIGPASGVETIQIVVP